jgi:CDP-diacylglycerol--glycerol-3-phosphate 3-phosphatidyltransferase
LTDGRYAACWSRLHGGLEPSPLVGRWLAVMWTLARPLAAIGVPPTAITVVGVGAALSAPFLAGALPLVSLALVLGSALCDGLDGAVAVVGARATRSGAAADAVGDRVADCAFAATIWQCGAPLWLAAVAAGLSLTHETLRALPAGRRLRTTITVAERPTRVVCTALACVSAAVTTATWPPAVCAAAWVVAGVGASGQFAAARWRVPRRA